MNTIPLSLNGLESDISPLYQKANVYLMSLTAAFVQGSICLLVDCCGMIKNLRSSKILTVFQLTAYISQY